MSTAKSEVSALLESLPEDASLEDIQYHLYVLEKVKKGEDLECGSSTNSIRDFQWRI